MTESFVQIVRQGDRRQSLIALRDQLASAISDASPRDLAPLSRQLANILRELESDDAEVEGSLIDDLAAARAAREANTATG